MRQLETLLRILNYFPGAWGKELFSELFFRIIDQHAFFEFLSF